MEQYKLRLLFWESTQRCNLACSHCRMDTERTYKELSTEQVFEMIDAIKAFSDPIFVISGGEPLMRLDIFEIVDYANQKGLKIALATNGTLIDQVITSKIKDSGIRRVSVSIDGIDAKTHDAFRRFEGAFDKAMTGIDFLVKSGISCQINATLTKQNVHQLEEMIKLAISKKADAIHLFLVVPVGCGKYLDESEKLSIEEYEAALDQVYKLNQKYKDQMFIKVTCAPQYYRILKQKDPQAFDNETHSMHSVSKGCLAGTGVCFVSSVGDVYPCGYLPVSAGNILEKPLSEIWSASETFITLRDVSLLEESCKSCLYTSVCGGCRARAYYSSSGDIMARDNSCVINR